VKRALSKGAGNDRKLEEAVLRELTAAAILKNVEFEVLQTWSPPEQLNRNMVSNTTQRHTLFWAESGPSPLKIKTRIWLHHVMQFPAIILVQFGSTRVYTVHTSDRTTGCQRLSRRLLLPSSHRMHPPTQAIAFPPSLHRTLHLNYYAA
jgi:hypothetical protein